MTPPDEAYDDQNDVERERTRLSQLNSPVEMRGLPVFGQIVSQRLWRREEDFRTRPPAQPVIIAETEVAETEVAETEVAETEVAETEVAETEVFAEMVDQTEPSAESLAEMPEITEEQWKTARRRKPRAPVAEPEIQQYAEMPEE